jgi:hypothetical protein
LLDPWLPNHHLEKSLPEKERDLIAEWRDSFPGSWVRAGEWRVLLYYGIFQDSTGGLAFREGVLSQYISQFKLHLDISQFISQYKNLYQ